MQKLIRLRLADWLSICLQKTTARGISELCIVIAIEYGQSH